MENELVELSPANAVLGYDKDKKPITLIEIAEDVVNGWSKIENFTSVGQVAYWACRLARPSDIPKHKSFVARKFPDGNKAIFQKPIYYN
ncbi:MAG TPA: hypothetical protein PK514_14715 [Spirochaetota bacterium]|nr:hypothetical protein [Spirochaetota bacterium]